MRSAWKSIAVLVGAGMLINGCMPYKGEKFVEVQNNETAFVIPLEDNLQKQRKLDSMEALKGYQVAIKRVNIPRRWRKTGRLWFSGEWIDTVKVVKVDRSPVTREWTAARDTGTSNKNQGIWIESEDSVSFSTGFNCTAFIKEEDAPRFLYHYPNGRLATIMDNQVRAEIQSMAAEIASRYRMDELRTKKGEIIKGVRQHVVAFFDKSGISVTTIGMFGGFTYENSDIQKAIDDTFVAQQEKVVAAALYDAQEDKNRRMVKEAEAVKRSAVIKAAGEAEAVRVVAEAAAEANANPAFIELRRLEVESERIAKWNGQYPRQYWSTAAMDGIGVLVGAEPLPAQD